MAYIETWVKQEMTKPVKVQYLGGNLFSQDSQGNLLGVELYKDGVAYSGGGTVSGTVIRADGGTVAVTGSISGNKAQIILPAAAYVVVGGVTIIIKLTQGGQTVTVGAFVSMVYATSTNTIVDPGTIIPSVAEMINQIQTAIDSIPPDYSALVGQVDDLKSAFDDTVQLITEKVYAYSPTYVRKNTNDYGEITTGSWLRATSEELIGFNTAYSVKISKKAGYSITVYFFNSSKEYTNRINRTGTGAEEYAIPVGVGYFRIKISKNDTSAEISIAEAEENVSIEYTFLYDSLTDGMQTAKIENLEKFDGLFDVETNLINPSEMTSGYINIEGTVIENSSYKTTDFIPVKANQSICFTTRLRKFLAFDALKRPIASTFKNNDVSAGYVFTATVDGFVRASVYVSDANYMAVYGNQVKEYMPYGKIIIKNLKLTDDSGANAGNILYGKKWAVCGDSFTAGDFTGASDYTFPDGRFAGQNKVYSRHIALRNDMTLQFLAGGGRTLAYPSDGTFSNSFTNPSADFKYTNIASDVDYITLYFGINDSHHEAGSSGTDGEDTTGEIPLGTINDTTTATFYGAWNVVLEWIATNRPFAHVGIIVSNGCDRDAYRVATIECAKKWGFPYIDLNGDEKTPLMLRSTNPNISSTVKAIRTSAQRVSSTNAHPNVSAHLYESTFIEDFLRSI